MCNLTEAFPLYAPYIRVRFCKSYQICYVNIEIAAKTLSFMVPRWWIGIFKKCLKTHLFFKSVYLVNLLEAYSIDKVLVFAFFHSASITAFLCF